MQAALCHWRCCPEEPPHYADHGGMSRQGNQGSRAANGAVLEAPCLGQLGGREGRRGGYDTVEEAVESM